MSPFGGWFKSTNIQIYLLFYVETKEIYVRKHDQESKLSMMKVLSKLDPVFFVYTLYYECEA